MPNKRVHCWTLHSFVVWCTRVWERQNWRPAACLFMDSQWTIVSEKRKRYAGVLLAYIAAHYLFIVASDCSSGFSKKLKHRDRQIGHLWILFAYSSFFSFVPYSLVWLTCRFHHRNCLHSFYLLLFYYDTQINVVKLPFAIDPQPDSWVESQLNRWRTLEAINGLLERKK